MSEVGLIHRHRRPHGITKADTETQNRENLIKRNFSADMPLKKLLTDTEFTTEYVIETDNNALNNGNITVNKN